MTDFTDFTAIGIVALMIVLGYYATNKVFAHLVEHLERQQITLTQILITQEACHDELLAIKESFDKNLPNEDIKEPGTTWKRG